MADTRGTFAETERTEVDSTDTVTDWSTGASNKGTVTDGGQYG